MWRPSQYGTGTINLQDRHNTRSILASRPTPRDRQGPPSMPRA